PAAVLARRLAAALEVEWGAPRDGWDALRVLRADTAAVAAWLDFARRAEDAQAWLVARDAVIAAFARSRTPALVLRAATDAMNGGDSRSALALATSLPADTGTASLAALPLRLQALAALGRPAEAESTLAAVRTRVSAEQYTRLARTVAWGWIRSGDIAKARAALAGVSDEGDDPVYGWLALYEGDLKTARRLLKSQVDPNPDLISALALLSRTRAERGTEAAQAFLTLARGDTARAAIAFEQAAAALPEAGTLLLATAARLHAARRDVRRAVAIWSGIVERQADSPEAPEAELEWARALRRGGEHAAAVTRLEHLILSYPRSALLPQARRELELARATVPPTV
ncbi:MAG: hypothetical protein WKG32_03355, partial [Gemmatimonadaceae bacterium]